MRIYFYHIIVLLSLASCKSKSIEKPIWLNTSATLQMPDAVLQFESTENNWEATLQSFTQPIPLKINYNATGFTIELLNKEGIIEGPAKIILSNGKHYFIYDLYLTNKQAIITIKDHRSPKTVNPDSSLQQQRIFYQTDVNRNIIANSKTFFNEEVITLSPKAGTYRAIATEPLTAYYVQAGSCESINVKSAYDKEKNLFAVTAGTLKDKYNNTVADGTVVTFIYSNEIQTWRMEAALLDGVATIVIPATNKKYTLHAKVNETISNTITLIP